MLEAKLLESKRFLIDLVWEYVIRIKDILVTQPQRDVEKLNLEEEEEGQVLRKLLNHSHFWSLLVNAPPNSIEESDNLLETC